MALADAPPDLAIARGATGPATRAAVKALGGISNFVRPGNKEVIKPSRKTAVRGQRFAVIRQGMTMNSIEAPFAVTIEIPVAWGEMDAFGHVNNTVYFRYCESARIAYFERLALMEAMAESGIGPILASAQCRFKAPLTYPDRVDVGATVTAMGRDRFTMAYYIFSRRLERAAASGEGLVVAYDYRAGKKVPLPSALCKAILALEASAGRHPREET